MIKKTDCKPVPNGDAFTQFRLDMGWRQLDAQEQCGISRRTIQRIENSDPSVGEITLVKYAEELGMPFTQIYVEESSGYWHPHATDDAFEGRPWTLSDPARGEVDPDRLGFCQTVAEAETVVKTLRKSWRIHLDDAENDNKMFDFADQRLDREFSNGLQRYLKIWARYPRTILCSMVDGKKTGASVMLPVTDDAYERLLQGDINYTQISHKDVLPCSQNLVFDSVTEFANAPRKRWYEVTDSLSAAVFHQTAILCENPDRPDFRALSFGASSTNIRRMELVGFRKNGVVMPDFDFPILEFSRFTECGDDELDDVRSTCAHYLRIFKNKIKGFLGKHVSVSASIMVRLRQTLMINALSRYRKKMLGADQRDVA